MTNRSYVAILPEQRETYDVALAALGYESRAAFITRHVPAFSGARERVVFGFDHNHVCAYESNRAHFLRDGFLVKDCLADKDFDAVLAETLDHFASETEEGRPLRVGVDLSCFNRYRLASIVSRLDGLQCALVDYWYSLAAFVPPAIESSRNEYVGPIHQAFAGWFLDPGKPLAMVAGLGYEQGKVVGAAEYLQASRVVGFFPRSPIQEYEPKVVSANQLILEELSSTGDVIDYRVADPLSTLAALDSVVRGLLPTHNVVLLPLGPKLFVLSCLLCQQLHPEVSVWRVSSGTGLKPRDIAPSSFVMGLGVSLSQLSRT